METTQQYLEAISRFLERLTRRNRRLLLVEWTAFMASAVTLALAVAGILLSMGFSVRLVVYTVVCMLGVAMIGLWRMGSGRWSQAGLKSVQAKGVEACLPGLRGRLLTVVERGDDPGAASPVLFERAASHARRAIGLVDPSHVHSAAPARKGWGVFAAMLVMVAVVGSRLPVGPIDAVRVIMGHSAAAIRLADAAAEPEEDAALVGDITLRYVFPEYTGMSPRVVPNSDGTIIAPPGTQVYVRARSAESVDAAAIQLDSRDPVDARLVGGRDLSAQITVQETGTWKILLFQGDGVRTTPPYEVRVEADQPPVVVTSETGETVAPVDAPLGLGWQATDDYGIVRVGLEMVRTGAATEEVIREPLEAVTELSGVIWATPRKLGLKPGDSVEIRVVAVDNNRLEGGSQGYSEVLTLQVMGPRGYGKNLTRYQEKLRDALLDVLADFLEDPAPPAETRKGLLRWLYDARLRFDGVRKVMEDQWGDEIPSGIDGELVQDVMEASGRLFRFTMTTFDRDTESGGQQPVDGDFDTFFRLHAETVEQLEIAVFVIDTMLREVGVSELARQAKIVADESTDLAKVAQDSTDAGLMTARLDRLERQLGKLRRAATKLQDDNLAGFIDGTIDQSEAMTESIRAAISADEIDSARLMMDLLAEQLQQLSESLNERDLRRQEASEEMSERFKQLLEDLDALAEQQDAAAQTLAEAQDDEGAEFSDLVAIWERLDRLAATFESQVQTAIGAVGDGRGWRSFTIKQIEGLVHLGAGIRDSVRGRDIQGVALRLTEAGSSLPLVERFLPRDRGMDSPPGLSNVVQARNAAEVTHRQMLDLLQELALRPEESSPALLAIGAEVSKEQGTLQDQQRTLEGQVQEVESSMPTSTGDATDAMKQAGRAMEYARAALEGSLPMQAEGQQRHAAMLVRETKEHLQQAASKQQQMQQMMQRMKGQQGEEGSKTSNNMTNADIPAPELFKTPEAYRQALLEGMAGSVPEEFKALKRRFYEDLVRQ